MASSPRSHPVYSITERTSLFMYDNVVTQVTKRICLKFHPPHYPLKVSVPEMMLLNICIIAHFGTKFSVK